MLRKVAFVFIQQGVSLLQRFNLQRLFLLSLILISTVWSVLLVGAFVPWPSTPTPNAVFSEVTGKPVSAEVSELVAIRRQHFIKRWAWMRFRVTQRGMNLFAHSLERIDEPYFVQQALLGNRGIVNHWFEARDRRAVGWAEVARIAKPQVYRVSSYSDGFFWVGSLILDRKNHLVYVQASGD